MIYDQNIETNLLIVLADSDDENGVFFIRRQEVEKGAYPPEFLKSHESDPDLDGTSEFHLREMAKMGLVEHLEGWSTSEGLQYRLTKAGSDQLSNAKENKSLASVSRHFGWLHSNYIKPIFIVVIAALLLGYCGLRA